MIIWKFVRFWFSCRRVWLHIRSDTCVMKNASMPTKKVISEKLLHWINLCAFENEKCVCGNTTFSPQPFLVVLLSYLDRILVLEERMLRRNEQTSNTSIASPTFFLRLPVFQCLLKLRNELCCRNKQNYHWMNVCLNRKFYSPFYFSSIEQPRSLLPNNNI